MTAAGDGLVEAEVEQFRALLGRTSQVDPLLKRELRRRIREVAKTGSARVRTEVMKPPIQRSRHRSRSTGLRRTIAGAITQQVKTGRSGTGVVLRARASKLGARAQLVRRYNSPRGWRHPVWGNRSAWVQQRGRPYWRAVLDDLGPELTDAIRAAIRDATRSLRD